MRPAATAPEQHPLAGAERELLGQGRTPMKEQRGRCKQCGERFTVVRFERERTSAYCDLCRDERKRDQARERMRTWRQRQRRRGS